MKDFWYNFGDYIVIDLWYIILWWFMIWCFSLDIIMIDIDQCFYRYDDLWFMILDDLWYDDFSIDHIVSNDTDDR